MRHVSIREAPVNATAKERKKELIKERGEAAQGDTPAPFPYDAWKKEYEGV